MPLESEQSPQNLAGENRTASGDPSTATRSNKRRKPDDAHNDNGCDNNGELRQSNETLVVVKRMRKDAPTGTAIIVEVDADFDQNPDDSDEYCDASSANGNDGAMQSNGQRAIDSTEAFKQGYVVVIPSMQT